MKGRRIAIATGVVALGVLGVAGWLGWPHLVFWYRFAPLGSNAFGFPEYRHRQTGIVMVRLPGGKYWMGAQRTDPNGQNYDPEAEDNEGPVHEVTLSPFLIGKYEVTREQWERTMLSLPNVFDWGFHGELCSEDDAVMPIDGVSWQEVKDFGNRTGLLLPTEAQWEYACRGNSTKPFAGDLNDLAWFRQSRIQGIGQKMPNAFGVHDMHGNAGEWCEDAYEQVFYQRPDANSPDPALRIESEYRVCRGGSVWVTDTECRCACRVRLTSNGRCGAIGFRVAYPSP